MKMENRSAVLLAGSLFAMLLLKGIGELTGTMAYIRPLGLALTAVAVFAFLGLYKEGRAELKTEPKTQREKYLEQLETLRKAGLIEKNEYAQLRERYLNTEYPKEDL